MATPGSTPIPVLPPGSTVAVIGGGSIGIFAAKELKEAGFRVTVFEKSPHVGEVWGGGKHWDSLTTNSSSTLMRISCFDFPEELKVPDFPHRSHIAKYIEAYMDHFGVRFAPPMPLPSSSCCKL